MREIKYRGQRIDTKEWVYGCIWFSLIDGDLTKSEKCIFITFNSMDSIGKVYRNTFEVIEETVGQYTGLHDKNGVEIYEGDTVKIDGEDEEDVFVIEWDGDTARFVMSIDIFTVDFDNYYGYECEVIGNIHENNS